MREFAYKCHKDMGFSFSTKTALRRFVQRNLQFVCQLVKCMSSHIRIVQGAWQIINIKLGWEKIPASLIFNFRRGGRLLLLAINYYTIQAIKSRYSFANYENILQSQEMTLALAFMRNRLTLLPGYN